MSTKEPIIQKVGEGRTVQHLPIEIHTSKLLDWLVDRKIVPQAWSKSYTDVRNRFPAALQEIADIPELKALNLTTDSLSYWTVLSVVETLRTINGGKEASKNFLGQYTSKRMKEWDALQRAYEKDHLYLAESAQFLTSAVNFELPALKKSVDKYSRQLTESQRKETELFRAIDNYKAKYASACRELNIAGKDVKAEIQDIASQLGPMFDDFARLAQDPGVKRAVDYYALFVRYAQGQTNKEQSAQWPVCEMLLCVHERGNEPVSQYIARKHPHLASAAPADSHPTNQATEEAPSEIKWDVEDEAKPEPKIDWGDVGISVADSGVTVAESGTEPAAAAPLSIAWIDDVTDQSAEAPAINEPAEASDEAHLRALLTSTEKILENNEFRNQLLGDAIELDAFFQRRADEIDSKDVLAMSQVQYAPVEVQKETKETIKELAAPVRRLLAALDAERVHRLLEIRNSKRYVDRLTAAIKQHLQVAEKLEHSIEELRAKRKDTDVQLKEQYPQMEVLQARVKEVRAKVEAALSKIYDGRTVTLFDS